MYMLNKEEYTSNNYEESSYLLENETQNCHCKSVMREKEISFCSIVKQNRPFRLYIMSYLISQAGEWFTYVASIELIEQLLGSKSIESRRYISLLVVCRLIPNFLLIPFSGVLADGNDRRKNMIYLDLIGAVAPLIYLVASHFKSMELVYAATLFQSSIGALYEPSRSSILPLMMIDERSINKATTLAGLAWAMMTAIGSGLGGYYVAVLGVNSCFLIDTLSFLTSSLLLYQIGGDWNTAPGKSMYVSLCSRVENMTVSGMRYILGSSFWPLVFLKASTAFVYGGSDVLNVSFAEENPMDSQRKQSEKLGSLFTAVGAGCLFLPLIVHKWRSDKDPKSVLNTCILSFMLQSFGCLGQGYFKSFPLALIFTMIRSGGGNIAWIESQILLQLVVKDEMLGRVVAMDFGFALLSEALSATCAGMLQDIFHLSARQISQIMGYTALVMFVTWAIISINCNEKFLKRK